MVGEVDQIPNDENKEPIEIKIVKEEVDNPCDENCSIILTESDDEEEKKEGTGEKDFHILKFYKEESELIEDLQEKLDNTIFLKEKEIQIYINFMKLGTKESNLKVKNIRTKRARDLFYKLFLKKLSFINLEIK